MSSNLFKQKWYIPDKDGRRMILTHNGHNWGLFHRIHNGFSTELIAGSGESVDGRRVDVRNALPGRQLVSYCEFDLDAARTESIIFNYWLKFKHFTQSICLWSMCKGVYKWKAKGSWPPCPCKIGQEKYFLCLLSSILSFWIRYKKWTGSISNYLNNT